MKTVVAGEPHEAFYQEFCALLKKHGAHLSSQELLAVAANLVGKMIALQDQRTMTPERALEIVAHNIEVGNQQSVASLTNAPAGRPN